jgi:hypothetical protein
MFSRYDRPTKVSNEYSQIYSLLIIFFEMLFRLTLLLIFVGGICFIFSFVLSIDNNSNITLCNKNNFNFELLFGICTFFVIVSMHITCINLVVGPMPLF